MTLNNIIDGLNEYFKENDTYFDATRDITFIEIEIEWGDWKHEHGYCDYLVEQYMNSIGARYLNSVTVTEEDGSDCYSAIHRYVVLNDENFSYEF